MGPKTQALMDEDQARRGREELLTLRLDRVPLEKNPLLGRTYRAGDLPARSVVRWLTSCEYVVGRSGLLMRWEQPIPGSRDWEVEYVGRLAPGEWMTPRDRAEVDEAII